MAEGTKIDWTFFDVRGFEPEVDGNGDERFDRILDGTDPEFYKSPWADADDGQVFARQWADGTVQLGRKEDDAVVLWEPNQDGALARLILMRKCWLYNTIEQLQKELTALGGWDG